MHDFDAVQARIQRDLGITHLGGVPWYRAEEPPWDHDCWAQTTSSIMSIERCPCGGMRNPLRPEWAWFNRNENRKNRGETERLIERVVRRRAARRWFRRSR